MEIVFHLGAHCTDDGLLIRSILQNRALLAKEGIIVPSPLAYRDLFSEHSTRLRGAAAEPRIEELILEAICTDQDADRVVLHNDSFLCGTKMILEGIDLYPKANKSAWLRQCLPSHDAEFAIAIRNPAGLLPDLKSRYGIEPPEGEALGEILWSKVIKSIAKHNPGCPITVWSHEDTPFIWPQLMRELTGNDPYLKLEGGYDMVETIMSDEGMKRLNEFLDMQNDLTETKRRRAISAFLEAHAIRDEIEEEVALPGWSEATIDVLSEIYEEDIDRIDRIPGVNFIHP